MRFVFRNITTNVLPAHLQRVGLFIMAGLFLVATPEALGYPDYNTNPIAPDYSGMESSAPEIAGRIQNGWNIGNTLEAIGGETAWGNPAVTANLIQLVKQSGFDAVRIPCSWDQYANQGTAEIDMNWLNRVKQVVQYCVDEDLYVILNIHWDGGWLENNCTPAKQAENNAKQQAYWEQIATHLRDFDEYLIFASANEPNVDDATQMNVLMSYHQTFVDAVRSTGGRNAYRTLVVQGPNTDIERTDTLMNSMPVDTIPNRMMLEVHFYTPYQFTLMTSDATWGNQFYYWGAGYHSTTDPDHNPTWGEEAEVDRLFGLMKTKFVDQGIPVVIGEFGAIRRLSLTGSDLTLHLASRAHFHDYITEQANANGLLPFYWDNGYSSDHQFGIFDRWSNTVSDQPSLDALTLIQTDQYWAEHGQDYADSAGPATNPVPADGASGIALSENLSWTTGANAESHRVFFGYDSNTVATATTNSPEFQGVQAGTVYDPGTLAPSGRFYWRVDETKGSLVTPGPVWTFATAVAPEGGSVAGAILPGESTFDVSFSSRLGQAYLVESTDSLIPSSWTTVSNNIPGTGNTIHIQDSTITTQRFYRVTILAP